MFGWVCVCESERTMGEIFERWQNKLMIWVLCVDGGCLGLAEYGIGSICDSGGCGVSVESGV